MIGFAETSRVEIVKEADTIGVPAPPEIAGEGPETLLRGGDEAVEGAGFADDGSDLVGCFDEHTDLGFAEGARLFGLDDKNALEDAAIDERDAKEGVVSLFAGLLEVFVTGMIDCVGDCYGTHLFGDESGEAFVE